MSTSRDTLFGAVLRTIVGEDWRSGCPGGKLLGRSRAREALELPPDDEERSSWREGVEDDVLEVLDGLRGPDGLPTSLQRVFDVVERLRAWLHWDDGLRDGLVDFLLGAVREAERFGDGTGPFKRRFATDVVIRAIERDSFGGPLPGLFRETMAPFVGILLDLTVATLNERKAWQPVKRVALPLLFKGHFGRLARLGLRLWSWWITLRGLLFAPTKYERHLRDAVRRLEPERKRLRELVPRDRLVTVGNEVLTTFSAIGRLVAPHARTIDALLRISRDIVGPDGERRHEVVVIAMRVLLKEAYADRRFVVGLVDSPLGDFVLDEVVYAMGRLFDRLDVHPATPALSDGAPGAAVAIS